MVVTGIHVLAGTDKIDCVQYDWELIKTLALELLHRVYSNDEKNGADFVSVAILAKSKILAATFGCGKDLRSRCKGARVPSINPDENVLKTTQLFDDLKHNGRLVLAGGTIVEVENLFCIHVIDFVKTYSVLRLFGPDFDSVHVHTKCIYPQVVLVIELEADICSHPSKLKHCVEIYHEKKPRWTAKPTFRLVFGEKKYLL
ncbi:hypothetical protein QAD02_004894 [Eretmocerus hayati]|uniref:Uncharacterized protein n=1 Tax=Eretmocerus hayati TaxID=131215 RepID=A0ACC2NTT9_9HYME|nr:hypothetical protein QAD02_004894 [Eretmocerus hayati]